MPHLGSQTLPGDVGDVVIIDGQQVPPTVLGARRELVEKYKSLYKRTRSLEDGQMKDWVGTGLVSDISEVVSLIQMVLWDSLDSFLFASLPWK